MKNLIFFPLAFLLFPFLVFAQSPLEGYIFEENNRGYLQQVKVSIYQLPENALLEELYSDETGHFLTKLPNGTYRLVFKKDIFHEKMDTVTLQNDKVFLKVEMNRKPGYLFDATLAEARTDPDMIVDAIQNATIEIYNRTQKKPELILKNHKDAFFQFTFEQGNHYTIMIRKPGYLTKRIEAYVNVKGCIICIDGVSNLRPGVTDNLTAGNTMGTLLCNIDLEKISLDKRIGLQNIYYDYNKWDIRTDAALELDKAVQLLLANPSISVELGSHTDARGGDTYNLELSQKRAESAVAYIISEGVDAARITAKGYGETQIQNRCKNGVNCSEEEHQKNRRTELRITGISAQDLAMLQWQSLEEIVREEEFKIALKALSEEKEVKIDPDAPAPRPIPQPEANNSVPLPKFEPEKSSMPSSTPPEIEAKPTSTDVTQQVEDVPIFHDQENSTAMTTEDLTTSSVALRTAGKKLPEDYTGYNIEIARTDLELNKNHTIFQQHGEVYLQKNNEGLNCYFIGDFDNLAVAKNYFQTIALPKYPNAKLCSFIRGVKFYQ